MLDNKCQQCSGYLQSEPYCFGTLQIFSTGSIDYNQCRKISNLSLQLIVVFSLLCRNKNLAIAIK